MKNKLATNMDDGINFMHQMVVGVEWGELLPLEIDEESCYQWAMPPWDNKEAILASKLNSYLLRFPSRLAPLYAIFFVFKKG